jgi:serine/threonine protein kinase
MKYAFQTKSKLFLVFEYVQGGELFFHLDKSQYFTEERSRFYAAEVLLTLEFLHNQKIIFRDLKPENILLDQTGHIKITDFGLAKDFTATSKEKANSFCGTAEYLAPEIIQNKEYDKSVDYWALGILLYEMLTGAPPFEDDNRNNLYNKILHAQPDFKHPNISVPAGDLLKRMLEKDIKARMKPEDIKKHPFFKTIDFTKLLLKEIQPPFIPAQDKHSLTINIAEEFKGEQLKETASASTTIPGKDGQFSHFTYLPNGNSINDEGVTAKQIK